MEKPAIVSTQGAQPLTPQAVMQPAWGFMVTQILLTATELEVFTRIDEGRQTVKEVAEGSGADERGMRMLLNALCGIGMLTKQGERYELSPASKTFLSKKSPRYLGAMILQGNRQITPQWAQLTSVIRTGKPSIDVESKDNGGAFFAEFVDAMYNLNVKAAEVAAESVLSRLPQADKEIRVLDIGAGSGVWSLAFARRDPRVRITVADFPTVIEKATKAFVARAGAQDRVDYLPGSFREADFGEAKYDVAILGHICHSEGEQHTKQLFRKVRQALKPEGQLVIAEFIADEGRAHDTMPLLFAVNMLVHTEEGDTFTMSEYQQWLEEAGFGEFEAIEAPSPSPLMVARKHAAAEERIAA